MDENNPFSHFGPDPFLPFIANYEEQYQPAEDHWANTHFGFDGTQDLSFFSNPGFLNNMDILRPFVPEPTHVAYTNQDTPIIPGPTHNHNQNRNLNRNIVPTSNSIPQAQSQATESSIPVLDSATSSESPAPTTTKKTRTVSQSKDISLKSDPSDKEALLNNKRARNLVASAKFREKKKKREAELEKTAKEMTEKAQALEKKVEELESQIKLLRSLLLDKTSH